MEQSCLGNWIITGEGGFAVVGLGVTRGSTGTARGLYIYIYILSVNTGTRVRGNIDKYIVVIFHLEYRCLERYRYIGGEGRKGRKDDGRNCKVSRKYKLRG